MNISAKFQLYTSYGFWGDYFLIFFANLSFLLPCQPIKFSILVEYYSRNISEKVCQNICSKIEIKAYFHFLHYKSMETISCHSYEST